jgi:hypothetical protein
MDVMAAGMTDTRNSGSILDGLLVLYLKSVEIGTKCDYRQLGVCGLGRNLA